MLTTAKGVGPKWTIARLRLGPSLKSAPFLELKNVDRG